VYVIFYCFYVVLLCEYSINNNCSRSFDV